MDGSKSSSLRHRAIRQQMLLCFCSRRGRVHKSTKHSDVEGRSRVYVTCGNRDSSKRCIYYQWIDPRWLGEADVTLTADAALQDGLSGLHTSLRI